MKNSIILVAILTILVIPMSSFALANDAVSDIELEKKFNAAQELLFKLLFPNSQARTEPETFSEEKQLLDDFQKLADYFIDDQELTIPFLADQLAVTPAESLEPGVCALQLLFEINTPTSMKIIQHAKKHQSESVAQLAKGIIDSDQDALWGFRSMRRQPTYGSDAKKLWNNKVEYIGNASKVVNLVDMVFGEKCGHHKQELQTKNEPYGLIISFTETTQEFLKLDCEKNILKLLALIKNAGYIKVEYNDDIYQLSAEEASNKLGYNIKDLYESERKYLQFDHE